MPDADPYEDDDEEDAVARAGSLSNGIRHPDIDEGDAGQRKRPPQVPVSPRHQVATHADRDIAQVDCQRQRLSLAQTVRQYVVGDPDEPDQREQQAGLARRRLLAGERCHEPPNRCGHPVLAFIAAPSWRQTAESGRRPTLVYAPHRAWPAGSERSSAKWTERPDLERAVSRSCGGT